ncbi:hypothetical protein V8F20_001237 [Naviculisporaceae sp. PSN 640]
MLACKITSALAVLGSFFTYASAGVPASRDGASILSARDPKAVCCTTGCGFCTSISCEEDPCTVSIWFSNCCAAELLTADTKFYDIDNNLLNITLDEVIATLNG